AAGPIARMRHASDAIGAVDSRPRASEHECPFRLRGRIEQDARGSLAAVTFALRLLGLRAALSGVPVARSELWRRHSGRALALDLDVLLLPSRRLAIEPADPSFRVPGPAEERGDVPGDQIVAPDAAHNRQRATSRRGPLTTLRQHSG